MQPVLLNALLTILRAWTPAFSQTRSAERAVDQALGSLLSLGRRTLSRALWALGRQDQDWSADYRLHARAGWKPDRLFQPLLEQALPLCRGRAGLKVSMIAAAPSPNRTEAT